LQKLDCFTGKSATGLISTSRSMTKLPNLAVLIGASVKYRWLVWNPALFTGVIAWGRKESSVVALKYAKRHGLSLLRLEDGFIRSVGLGSEDPPLSIVMDDLGIYYDAASPSRLEYFVASKHSHAQLLRARKLIDLWRAKRVSKYNHAQEYQQALPERYVLVADQTFGDSSIAYGLADSSSFQCMLASALLEYPGCTILLKVHPEVMLGHKQGHFELSTVMQNPRVQLLDEDVHPVKLIEHAQALYTVTSQIGFEGLLWGKPVHTFGMPFYAGWGLTFDALPALERRNLSSLESLVYAALIDYPRYIDPETYIRCEVERVVEWMGVQREMCDISRNEADLYCVETCVYALGFSSWKRSVVRQCFPDSKVVFIAHAADVPVAGVLAVWGLKLVLGELAADVKIIRLEDGFLRSVGLGADLIRPMSWVVDGRGIYYDATRPSDLEYLLSNKTFSTDLLKRADLLRARLVVEGVTKYNVGINGWQRPAQLEKVILVPGQVESDASLAYGAPGICTNMGLLKAVRLANPSAYIVYKPHPDVVAGLRSKGVGETEALSYCDEQLVNVDMGELLIQVDEVHVMTSLAGFEALLRDKTVVCYGQPFYSGWGLTQDIIPNSRRGRRLLLDELVAGALIEYPLYLSRTQDKLISPEQSLDELLLWRDKVGKNTPWWRTLFRVVLRNIVGVR